VSPTADELRNQSMSDTPVMEGISGVGIAIQNQARSEEQAINNKITRKLEGGRPHKVFDYMFIQMSNEQF